MLYMKGGDTLLRGLREFDIAWENIKNAQLWVATEHDKDEAVARLCNAYPDAGFTCLIFD